MKMVQKVTRDILSTVEIKDYDVMNNGRIENNNFFIKIKSNLRA